MAELINLGDSFYKEVEVTYTNDGEEEPVNLSVYDDNYVAIKDSRDVADQDAYIFKNIPVKGIPEDGLLLLNLTPYETELLPVTANDGLQYIYGYVQIGSTVTGQVHEVSHFKIKTRKSGIKHITAVDQSYDMGCIKEVVGWVFDAEKLCDQTSMIIDFDDDNEGLLLYNAGALTATEVEIFDAGVLDLNMPLTIELGYIRECSRTFGSC